MSTQATNFNGNEWNLVNGEWIYVGPPLADDGGKETREDRATFFDLDR